MQRLSTRYLERPRRGSPPATPCARCGASSRLRFAREGRQIKLHITHPPRQIKLHIKLRIKMRARHMYVRLL